MDSKKERYVEFRYYEMPMGRHDLALLGDEWVCAYGRDPLHFHNYLEIGYCYYGEGYMVYGDEERDFSGGIITIIPSNFPHRTQGSAEEKCKWEYLFVDIVGLLNKYYGDNPVFREWFQNNILEKAYLLSAEQAPGLTAAMKALFEENRRPGRYSREIINGYLYILLHEIARLSEGTSLEVNGHQAQFIKIRRALDYIDDHYAEEIRIKDLADLCHTSESYFRKLFYHCMNVSPLEYMNFIRIQKVCSLMMTSDESIESLAWKTGFTSLSTFMRNFKKIVGDTPKQWMLKKKKDNAYVNYQTRVLKGW